MEKLNDAQKLCLVKQALTELTQPWTRLSLPPPSFQVKEVRRRTSVETDTINRFLKTNLLGVTDVSGKQWFAMAEGDPLAKPLKQSLNFNQQLAAIQQEGQRYQRRPQFPDGGTKSDTTTDRALSAAKAKQQAKQKMVFVSSLPTKEKVPTKKEQRQKVKLETRYSSPEIWISQAQRQLGQESVRKFMGYLESDSVVPPQGKTRIKDIIFDAVTYAEYGRQAEIANWICPPGTPLDFDPETGKLYRRFKGIDPEEGLKKDYRLYPRLDQERALVRNLEKASVPYRYTKIVADNNPYCLYPTAFALDGEKQTQDAIFSFATSAQQKLDQWIGEGKVNSATLSSLLGPESFQKFLSDFDRLDLASLLSFLPTDVLDVELDVIAKHTSLAPCYQQYLPSLVVDVVKQYGLEGDFVPRALGENTILAWNESTRRTAIIDSVRRLKGLDPIPKIFVLYEKKEGKIVNNF